MTAFSCDCMYDRKVALVDRVLKGKDHFYASFPSSTLMGLVSLPSNVRFALFIDLTCTSCPFVGRVCVMCARLTAAVGQ